jgi:lysophospholipase L1-like esterase
MENPDKIKVVCIGDSITGWNLTSSDGRGWPFKTYPEILAENFKLPIANQGYEGEVSFYAREITEKSLKKYPNAEHFIFLFGANDIEESIPQERQAEDVAKQVCSNLESCIGLIVQKQKKPVMLSIPHAFKIGWASEYNLKADECNARFKEYCAQQKIPFIDICTALRQEHFADGIHPNDKGAELIAKRVYEALAGIIK